MTVIYSLSHRYSEKQRTSVVTILGAKLDNALKLALNQRGWLENSDGDFKRECNSHQLNSTLWFLVKTFGVKLCWDQKLPIERTPEPSEIKLRPVAVEDMKIGMTISGHGKVESITPFTGRRLVRKGKRFSYVKGGTKGFLFKTTEHSDGCFYAAGSTVWTVKGGKHA